MALIPQLIEDRIAKLEEKVAFLEEQLALIVEALAPKDNRIKEK